MFENFITFVVISDVMIMPQEQCRDDVRCESDGDCMEEETCKNNQCCHSGGSSTGHDGQYF